MSVYKVNDSLSATKKIENINSMIIEVDGKVSNGKFDQNEITQIISDTAIDRKYLREQSLGHTLTTYANWTHVHSESGYSIFKISPTNYKYNALNELYVDNKLIENRLQANSETASVFDKVFLYNGDSASGYTDDTTEAGTEDGTSFEVMDSTEDYLYMGLSTTFAGISFEWDVRGSNYTLHCEYWNGTAWTELDISGATFTDDTSNFESDGRIYWDIPTNWATRTVNSIASKYWVRISTTTDPTTVGLAYLIQPANSVIDMLKLSSSEILNEEWAWCTYGTAIYVTIRNSGQSAYEGNYYITSSSTAINKQNYFIHNHQFTANYQDSTYATTSIYGYYLAPVKDKDLTAPPSTPVLGDRYLIITGDSGTWYGHDNEVAEFNSSSGWDFTTPREGMVLYADDENTWYNYNGSTWVLGFGASGYSGQSGFSGFSGASGTGDSGYSGWSGFSGEQGTSGYSGKSGYSGEVGAQGDSGYSGYSGYSGIGTSGYSGYSGIAGAGVVAKGIWSESTSYSLNDLVSYDFATWVSLQNTNLNNIPNESGSAYWSLFAEQGVMGDSGYSGFSGKSGFSGDSGYSGWSGYSGEVGTQGDSGYSGFSGEIGTSGYSGQSGYSGESGISGYSGGFSSGSDAVVGNLVVNGVAYFDIEYDNGNSGSTKTIDWANGNKQKLTLTDNPVYLTFDDFVISASTPACNLILKLIQDGTGSRTVIWPANVKWSGGTAPTLTTTANRVDLLSFYFDGTIYYGVSSLNYNIS